MYKEEAIISKWIADMYEKDETDTNDVEFLLSVIGSKPKHILEIACGSGRILVPLAKAGHIVTGLDFDPFMLSKIESKSEGLSNIFWRKADVIDDEWDNDYDIVVIAGNFLFNIISGTDYEKAQKLLIEKSAKSLVSGGSIYIDYGYTLHPESWYDDPGERVIWQGIDSDGNTGKMMLFGSTFDKETRIVNSTRRFEIQCVSGEIIKQDINTVKHFATLEQIYSWLASAGFVIEEEYGDYNSNPISETTSRAIISAKKI
ncbi:class I SAM-dependent methyltransferase [Lachnoclostridium phytofermentans]|uniref:class I SAM-dependent methyltransferase n=1 Tax=Lachnoclostridium phytofermentans TaxID=66219 RepID=UPI0002D9E74C|nr:class I SAM-dependent methyltransferase [Lachnoclostridium phytofermentans]